MLGAPHGPILPFECRILRESGASADSLWMAFPDYGSGGRAWVFLDGYAVTHASADGIAGASWTKIADNLTDGTRYRVGLAFADTGSSGSGYRWRWGVFVQSGSGALSWPAWADQTMPRVLLVDLQTAGNGTAAANVFKGLAQLHVGELHLTRSWIEYGGGAQAAGAYLVNRNGGVYVVDQNSKNFTYVNSVRVDANKEVRLKSGDRLTLADEEFVFNEN